MIIVSLGFYYFLILVGVDILLSGYLPYQVIKRMRGTLQFDSTLGVGTTASITLPLELASSDPQPRRSLGSQSRGYRGPRIISNEMAQLFASGMFPVPELPETLIERARTPVPASLSSGAPRQLRVRVEVIEDNPIARRILTTFLTKKASFQRNFVLCFR